MCRNVISSAGFNRNCVHSVLCLGNLHNSPSRRILGGRSYVGWNPTSSKHFQHELHSPYPRARTRASITVMPFRNGYLPGTRTKLITVIDSDVSDCVSTAGPGAI